MQRGLLVELATEVIKLIGSLSPIPPVDDVGLRQRFIDLLAEFHARALRAGLADDLVDTARHALVALIDERVTSLDAGIADTWKREPLRRHISVRSDTCLDDRLTALRPPATTEQAEVLEVFHLCLCFGLRASLRAAVDDDSRQRLIADLAREILAARGGSALPSSSNRQPIASATTAPPPRRWHDAIPLWVMPTTLLTLLLVWWVIASWWTGAAIARLATDFPVP